MARIGIEPAMTNIKQSLEELGHEVVVVSSERDAHGCDSIIISGTDKDMMGIADVHIEGPVLNAEGATTDEICQMVERRFN
ncbi:MAG TPA: YkuS family protein [Bacillota bacterium]|nr:YkuS family protein [Bacillota bacterium]